MRFLSRAFSGLMHHCNGASDAVAERLAVENGEQGQILVRKACCSKLMAVTVKLLKALNILDACLNKRLLSDEIMAAN